METCTPFHIEYNNREACTKECDKYHGIWNTTSNKCHVQMYLQEICLRVLYNNNTTNWNLDNPPYFLIFYYYFLVNGLYKVNRFKLVVSIQIQRIFIISLILQIGYHSIIHFQHQH